MAKRSGRDVTDPINADGGGVAAWVAPHGSVVNRTGATLIALGKKPRDAIYQYAGGPPDRSRYEDFSPLLRDILSRGLREAKSRAKT